LWPGRGQRSSTPKITSASATTTITHSEFIGNVYAEPNGTHTTTAYRINPATSDTFPWLSTIAPSYDQWRPRQINFRYVSSSANFNGSTQALGYVTMVPEYDVNDSIMLSRTQMEAAENSVTDRPSNNIICGLECKRASMMFGGLYKTGAPPTTAQLDKYDFANIEIGTGGVTAVGGTPILLGGLYVDYTIDLLKKQMPDIPAFFLQTINTAAQGAVSPKPFDATLMTVNSNIGVAYDTTTTIELPIPAGKYTVLVTVIGTGINPAQTFTVTALDQFGEIKSTTSTSGLWYTSTTAFLGQYLLTVTEASALLSVQSAISSTTTTQVKLIVAAVDPSAVA
jgi:hypothetical protein